MSGSGINWAIWKSAPCSRQVTMPATHHSVFTGRMPFLSPNQQRQTLKAKLVSKKCLKITKVDLFKKRFMIVLFHMRAGEDEH